MIDLRQKVVAVINNHERLIEGLFAVVKVRRLSQKMIGDLRTYFKKRQAWIEAALEREWSRFMESRADDITLRVYDMDEETQMLINILEPYYRESGMMGSDQAINMIRRRVGRELFFKGSREWIEDNAIRFGKKYSRLVSKTTNEAIRREVERAIANGETLNELMTRIQRVYRGVTTYRSEMIARTEMGRAFNMSSLIQSDKMGVSRYDWVGCDPDCEICGPFMADNPHTGEEIESFVMGETHPNCTGTEVALIPDDFEPQLD